jgi:crossover junction endodeoxyribonuclease RuvC
MQRRDAKRWRAAIVLANGTILLVSSSLRILGIDPGLNRTGYGVVEVNGSRLAFIAAGVIRVPAGDLHQRLGTILRSLAAVIRDTQPQVATVEKVFVNVNPQSTLLLGQARGAAICAAVAEGLVVHEYAALRIKQAVVGFGRADKRQVQTMVQRLLSLDRAPTSDAADALACAICHAHSASLLMALRSKANVAPRVRSTANGRRAWTARLQGLG